MSCVNDVGGVVFCEHVVHKLLVLLKVFGGAQMTPHISIQIGQANIDFVRHYLGLENIPIVSEDMGGILPRKVLFHPLSGKALMKSLPMSIVSKVNHQEQDYLQALDKNDQSTQNDIELF